MHPRTLACASILMLGFTTVSARAAVPSAPAPIYTLTEENDGIFSGQDRHYTQGIMFTRSAAPTADGFWDGLADDFGAVAGWLGAGPAVARRYQWPIVGQSEFTPSDITRSVPDPLDRPYAGWLYLGAGLTERSASGRTDHLELLLGVVGPWAGAKQVQDTFHQLAGYGQANGYRYQLRNEPGLLLGYQTTWNLALPLPGPVDADILPEAGVTLGNVLTYGDVGLTLRFGQGLAAGGSPRTVTPGLSGSGWFDPSQLDGAFGWMVYGGIQTRAVWRNMFLEGNSYRSSPGVRKRNFVTDEDVGISFLFRFGLRIDITYMKRGEEFWGQDSDDRLGSVSISTPF